MIKVLTKDNKVLEFEEGYVAPWFAYGEDEDDNDMYPIPVFFDNNKNIVGVRLKWDENHITEEEFLKLVNANFEELIEEDDIEEYDPIVKLTYNQKTNMIDSEECDF